MVLCYGLELKIIEIFQWNLSLISLLEAVSLYSVKYYRQLKFVRDALLLSLHSIIVEASCHLLRGVWHIWGRSH